MSADNNIKNNKSIIMSLEKVHSGYGKKEILHGVSLSVKIGSINALIGPNGSGKSTILKTIFGLVKARTGAISYDDKTCIDSKSSSLIQRGLVYVPQGNKVFPDLTVQQNLEVSLDGVSEKEKDSRLYELGKIFPILKDRQKQKAGKLSGGEKQQVALATALIKKPKMLLLDEPSLGLAPNFLDHVFKQLQYINQNFGVSILIVEQKVRKVLEIADWVYGLRLGEITLEGSPADIGTENNLRSLFLM